MNKTFVLKGKPKELNWHFIDASDQTLGRLASRVALLLMGKNKAIFSHTVNVGSKVVITNAEKIKVTGKKMTDKVYQWHTGWPKGLRERTLEKLMEKDPTEPLRKAIRGMLPKNKLQDERMTNLYIYKGPKHPHEAHEKTK